MDVEAFEEAAATARRASDPAAYQAALVLYAGELLPEDRYEAWAEERREALRETYLALLTGLAELHEERAEYEPAIEVLRRALNSEPACEEAHRGLIRLLAASGERRRAIAQYARLEKALSELGAEPADSSRHLHEEIAANRFPKALSRSGSSPSEEPAGPGHNLPNARTSFVGREKEMVEIKRSLAMTGVLTLTGTGGSGKTRLTLEVARDLVGTYFPSLRRLHQNPPLYLDSRAKYTLKQIESGTNAETRPGAESVISRLLEFPTRLRGDPARNQGVSPRRRPSPGSRAP